MPQSSPTAYNLHATGLVMDEAGVLVCGASGRGKTSLCLALVRCWRASGRFARLIGDDQVFLAAHGGRLLARAPAPIAGLAEIRGLGPQPVVFEPEAVIDLLVELVEPHTSPRLCEHPNRTLLGVAVPCLVLPEQDVPVAINAIVAALGRLEPAQSGHRHAPASK